MNNSTFNVLTNADMYSHSVHSLTYELSFVALNTAHGIFHSILMMLRTKIMIEMLLIQALWLYRFALNTVCNC